MQNFANLKSTTVKMSSTRHLPSQKIIFKTLGVSALDSYSFKTKRKRK
jgi:hypothetical protein